MRALERCWDVALADFAHAVAFSPSGAILGAATLAGSVVFLDAATGETIWAAPGHAGGALSLAWSPDGRCVATGGQDERVAILDVEACAVVAELDAPGGWVSQVAWSPDGAVLATASGPRVRFWSREWKPLGIPIEQASSVTALFFHPEIGWAAACYGGMQLLEPGVARPRERYPFRGSVVAAKPSPDGAMVALGTQDTTVRVWDRRRRNDAQLTGYPGKVAVLDWAPRGSILATAGGKDAVLWDCGGHGPRGSTPAKLSGHQGRISALVFVDDGERLLSSGLDGRIATWEPHETGWRASHWAETLGPVHALVDGSDRLAAVGAGGRISAWRR